MRVASHAKLRRSSQKKKRFKSSKAVAASSLDKAKRLSHSKKPIPSWARTAVFAHARIVAWEGTGHPFHAVKLFPSTGSFLDKVLLVRKGGIVHWSESIHPLDKNRVSKAFANVVTLPFEIEYRLIDTNGEFVWVRHSVIGIAKKNRLQIIKGFVRDIQAEKELELESLRISEREQNRIGQDLHDDLCQVLAGVSCLMRVIEGRLASKVPEEVASLSELNLQIIEAMHRTRALTHGLFPGKIYAVHC